MAIYHLSGQVISRSSGRTAVASAAYRARERLYNDYDGLTHDYTYRHDLLWKQIMLPPNAPATWNDRETLWNAVEASETQKNSRLAREFNVALPVELDLPEWKAILARFVQTQFVNEGMCADIALHNPGDGHNPHAHIMLTVRPFKENGEWANKTEKEYLCIRDGEERGFTAAEFKEAKLQVWEKQYPFFDGKKKVYLTAAKGEDRHLKRASKYPKCTKFGRQNSIVEKWNSEEFLQSCRVAWADIVNQQLEQNFIDARIDHRSNVERGMDEKPSIHEGVIARALERKGILSDRCELKRQIKADNNLRRELRAEVKHLERMARGDAASLAEALEKNKSMMIIIRYQIIFNARQLSEMKQTLDETLPVLREYHSVMKKLKPLQKQMKALKKKLDECSPIQFIHKMQIQNQMDALRQVMEPLRKNKTDIMHNLGYKDIDAVTEVEKKVDNIRSIIGQVEHRQHVLAGQEEELLQKHTKLLARVVPENTVAVTAEQEKLQLVQQDAIQKKLIDTYGDRYDSSILNHAIRITGESIRKHTREPAVKMQPRIDKEER